MNQRDGTESAGGDIRHILTIDVEDWYLAHLEFFGDSPSTPDDPPAPSIVSSTRKVLDLLDRTQNTATFFIQGTVAEYYPEVVKDIDSCGHEIASHGYLHRRLQHLTPAEFEQDLRRSLTALQNAGAPAIKGYRAPCFSITRQTLWAFEVIKNCGLQYDSSIFPVRRRLYGIYDWPATPTQNDQGLWEYPPATIRVCGFNLPVAGGGYLRMLPDSFFAVGAHSRRLLSPAVFYFHPYEFDPETVILRHRPRRLYGRAVALLERIGLSGTPAKIERLLREFRFSRLDHFLPS